jgi:steroid delta-isomerase-like uncharacterized protein
MDHGTYHRKGRRSQISRDRLRSANDGNLRAHPSRPIIDRKFKARVVRQNEKLIRRFIEELWNERRLELADDLIAGDCQTHQLRSGVAITSMPRGPAAIKAHITEWLVGFPDLKFTIDQMFSEGDKVFTQSVMTGTHTGTWLEIPATNKQVTVRMMTVHRIVEGKIAEDWVLVESLGFFQQLGLIATTPELLSQVRMQFGTSA